MIIIVYLQGAKVTIIIETNKFLAYYLKGDSFSEPNIKPEVMDEINLFRKTALCTQKQQNYARIFILSAFFFVTLEEIAGFLYIKAV